jgi:hypothetical protein
MIFRFTPWKRQHTDICMKWKFKNINKWPLQGHWDPLMVLKNVSQKARIWRLWTKLDMPGADAYKYKLKKNEEDPNQKFVVVVHFVPFLLFHLFIHRIVSRWLSPLVCPYFCMSLSSWTKCDSILLYFNIQMPTTIDSKEGDWLSTTSLITISRWSIDRNFPCQTLKIRNVSLVVMGS